MDGGWRRVLLAVIAGALATLVAAQVALAQEGLKQGDGDSGESVNRIKGTDRAQVIRGTSGIDVINGLGGGDALYGFWAPDLIHGGRGDDYVGGGKYGDRLYGDRGSDLITGEGGRDRVYGGSGNDDLYAGFRPGQPVPPNSPARSDRIYGEDGNDFVDSADARGAPDTVRCGDGFDTVIANRGDRVGSGCEVVRRVN